MKTKLYVKDPYNQEAKFKNRKNKNFKGLFKQDIVLIENYLDDMKNGINVFSGKKGSRSYARLNALKSRIPKIAKWVKQHYNKSLIDLTVLEATKLFNKLLNGEITKDDGTPYKSADDYVKDFKAFWNWYVRKKRREYNYMTEAQQKLVSKSDYLIPNITQDIPDNNNLKPQWHYFEPDYQKLRSNAKFDYQVLMDFLMDSGLRFPSEALNVRVSDIKEIDGEDKKALLTVRAETSKTKEPRTMKLMLCYPILKIYMKDNKLKDNDFLFNKNPKVINRYFKRLGYRVLGIGKKTYKKYKGKRKDQPDIKDGITGYDFRHNSACYWLSKYPTQSGLMLRFGWKTTKMIEYYTEFLGMNDNISDENLLIGSTKTEIEKQQAKLIQENELLKESIKSMTKDMELIKNFITSNPNIKKLIDSQSKS